MEEAYLRHHLNQENQVIARQVSSPASIKAPPDDKDAAAAAAATATNNSTSASTLLIRKPTTYYNEDEANEMNKNSKDLLQVLIDFFLNFTIGYLLLYRM